MMDVKIELKIELIEEIAEANWPDASVLFHELQFLRWPYSF
jgi:hypothetical protein